jgi:branched-chain amino acid transport system permease protein
MFVVVVVGGMGSLAGAFVASVLIGLIQTFAVARLVHAAGQLGKTLSRGRTRHYGFADLPVSQVAPILPYLLLVLMLILRPKGLLGTRLSAAVAAVTGARFNRSAGRWAVTRC